MMPVFIGKSLVYNTSTQIFETSGNCFDKITIKSNFTLNQKSADSKDYDLIKADIEITLDKSDSWLCMEHFVIGTPF